MDKAVEGFILRFNSGNQDEERSGSWEAICPECERQKDFKVKVRCTYDPDMDPESFANGGVGHRFTTLEVYLDEPAWKMPKESETGGTAED